MKELLNVKQRYAFRTIFKPDYCSIMEQDLYDEFLDKLKFTGKEIQELNMVTKNGETTWDVKKDKGIEVDIPKPLMELLKKAIKVADKKGRIPYDPDDHSVKNLAKKLLSYGTTDKETS